MACKIINKCQKMLLIITIYDIISAKSKQGLWVTFKNLNNYIRKNRLLMKISILTATYNRAHDLEKLYTSLVINSSSNIEYEWLIMDDGSTDKTKLVIDNFIKQNIIKIEYHYQENQGKMVAINNLMKFVTGDIVMECDSDDYFATGAFDIIKKHIDKLLNDETVYALAFLKKNENGDISGTSFIEDNHRSDMFSLYYKEKMTGEKILVYKTEIRKKYKHILEADEKFITEFRMYHKIDADYDVICINEAIIIGDYKSDGYVRNKKRVFELAPLGNYEYFKEILSMDLKGVPFSRKMYMYKYYILFANLAARSNAIKNVKGIFNKMMVSLLWIPITLLTKKNFKRKTVTNDFMDEGY